MRLANNLLDKKMGLKRLLTFNQKLRKFHPSIFLSDIIENTSQDFFNEAFVSHQPSQQKPTWRMSNGDTKKKKTMKICPFV